MRKVLFAFFKNFLVTEKVQVIDIRFHPLAFQAEGVLSLPASVRLSVRLSVRNLFLVCAITRHRFGLESPNLHQTCILGYSRLVLKMEVIEFGLQVHFGHFDSEFLEIWLVSAITCHRFGLESPNLHQTCILGYSRLVLKMEVIEFGLQVHFGHFDSEFLEIWFVSAITCHRFGLESPNLHQTCILGYSRLVLKMEVIEFGLQVHFGHFDSEFLEIWLVSAITCHSFGLESPNLHQTCILVYSRLVLKVKVIKFNLQGHFDHFDLVF